MKQKKKTPAQRICEHCDIPYPLPTIHPSWRTSAVVGITNAIVEAGAWDRLLPLSDALEDAGCTEDILCHLRFGKHLPGVFPSFTGGCWLGTCWVLQEILNQPQVFACSRDTHNLLAGAVVSHVIDPGAEGDIYMVYAGENYHHRRVYASQFVVAVSISEAKHKAAMSTPFGDRFRVPCSTVNPAALFPSDLNPFLSDTGYWQYVPLPDNMCYDPRIIVATCIQQRVPSEYDNPCNLYLNHHRYVGPSLPEHGVPAAMFRDEDLRVCLICRKRFWASNNRYLQYNHLVCSPDCFVKHVEARIEIPNQAVFICDSVSPDTELD